MNKHENIILCVRVIDKDEVHPDSVISQCNFGCGHKVWCQPHNLLEKKICIYCLKEKEEDLDIVKIDIKPEDLKKVGEYIYARRFRN